MTGTKFSKTAKTKAVQKVNSFIRTGLSISKARLTVARELSVTSNTLYNWSRSLNIATPVTTKTTTNVIKNNGVITHAKDYSFGDMAHDVRGVMRSIVKQDGRYTIKEANVVGKLYGNEISAAKLQLEVHKHNAKLTKRSNPVLSLT